MAKGEIIILGEDGGINTEMFGFTDGSCLNAAAEISNELKKIGVVTELTGIKMKSAMELAKDIVSVKTKMEVEQL